METAAAVRPIRAAQVHSAQSAPSVRDIRGERDAQPQSIRALEAQMEKHQKVSAETPTGENATPGERLPWSVRQADALARIAESFLAHGAEVLPSGDRHQIVVHVDAQTLRDGCAGRCEHEDGPALPAETARRLG